MILSIICAQSLAQARAFARDALGVTDVGRFWRNVVVVTRDEAQGGGPNSCVRGLHSSKPFYVVGGEETERACEQTIKFLTERGHPREQIDEDWQ